MKDVVAEKKKEFSALNISIFEAVENLFDGLHQQYLKERNRLRFYIYGNPA
jgi:cell division protein FtsB